MDSASDRVNNMSLKYRNRDSSSLGRTCQKGEGTSFMEELSTHFDWPVLEIMRHIANENERIWIQLLACFVWKCHDFLKWRLPMLCY